jgi:Spy/CpxP family protein refolding chaperone
VSEGFEERRAPIRRRVLASLIAGSVFALTLGIGLPSASANPRMHSEEQHAEQQMGMLFAHLHLSPEQKSKVNEIRKRSKDASGETRRKLREKRRALFVLIQRADATKEQASALQRDINTLQAQLADARIAAWFEARAVLTPDQRTRLSGSPLPGEPAAGQRH